LPLLVPLKFSTLWLAVAEVGIKALVVAPAVAVEQVGF
jgi:hypothetical protein